ncbi:SDR family oxidoreductase [Streptomyces sp. KL116D]|uniref:SDR family oxidoreductase n=1 Tax=Streptomyces sp. KL116D TaxID=3045152 RepID=UPI003555FBD3
MERSAARPSRCHRSRKKAGAIEQDNYSAAKGLAGNGVRVSAIQRPIRGGVTQAMSAQAWEATTVRIPMKWAGEPSGVGSVALLLASDLFSYGTGSVGKWPADVT